MKFISHLAASVIVGTTLTAQSLSDPPLTFKDRPALEAWTKTSFGGYEIKAFEHNKIEVLVVNLRHTSGVSSSEISIYLKSKRGWIRALQLGDYWNDHIHCEQRGDLVLLKAESTNTEVIRLSISGLGLQIAGES